MHINTHRYIYPHMKIHTCSHADIQIHMFTSHMLRYICAHMQIHRITHKYTCSHTDIHAHTDIDVHNADTHIHT